MTSKEKRDQIVTFKTAGISNRNIRKRLDVCCKIVINVWKRYTESAVTSSKSIPGRKRSIYTKPILQTVM